MIEIRGVSKRFDTFTALDQATLTVPQGAIYGLVGPNGAGKSTLIRCLTGVYRPEAGEALVDGQSVYENPGIKARMAVIPDDWFYFTQANVRDMMQFYRSFYPNFSMER